MIGAAVAHVAYSTSVLDLPRSSFCSTEKSETSFGRGQQGETQPADKDRAQTVHKTSPDQSASHEGTRDSKLDDHPKKSGAN
jgi:hypothetical protein